MAANCSNEVNVPASNSGTVAPNKRGRVIAGTLAALCLLLLVAGSILYASLAPHDRGHARNAIQTGIEAGDKAAGNPVAKDFLLSGKVRAMLWVTSLGLLFLAWFFVGRAFSESWFAIFISRNNRVSLSQLQFVLWTLLFASATLALFLIRFRGLRDADALGFALPTEAALLMGISSLSFGGAQVIQAAKRNRMPTETEIERAVRQKLRKVHPELAVRVRKQVTFGSLASQLDAAKGSLDAVDRAELKRIRRQVLEGMNGVLARDAPGKARPINLLQGDEVTNRDQMDLGKIQLAFFSLLAIVAYGVLLWRFFFHGSFFENAAGPFLGQMPAVSQGLVALLGGSHAGYLGGKAAGSTNTQA